MYVFSPNFEKEYVPEVAGSKSDLEYYRVSDETTPTIEEMQGLANFGMV